MTETPDTAATGREPAAAGRMRPGDERLVAALIQLDGELSKIAEEILAGDFDNEDRRALSITLATIAAEATATVASSGGLQLAAWPERHRNGPSEAGCPRCNGATRGDDHV